MGGIPVAFQEGMGILDADSRRSPSEDSVRLKREGFK